jgi:sialate O-acetylesterase
MIAATKALNLILLFMLAMTCHPLQAAVELAAPFRDGVVLQRAKPVNIWGTAAPREKIALTFHEQNKVARADEHGRWMITLDALAASAEPAVLTVTGESSSITVRDVLVGEVWLCSGQSNMNLALKEARNAGAEIRAAQFPLIHYFEVKSMISDEPLAEADGKWEVCSPETAANFTAVGYFFARELQRALGVPVGIFKSTLGGSPIEGWMSAEALRESGAAAQSAEATWKPLAAGYQSRLDDHRARLAEWKLQKENAQAAGVPPFTQARPEMAYERSDRHRPSGLYNGFIHPLAPMTLAGFLWYQGESNADAPADYRVLFPAMIRQWRQVFQQENLPFLFVQLPNYAPPKDQSGQSWAWFREVQAGVRSLPNVSMAVTIDIGEPANLHPTNKQEAGRRLALLALRKVYGRDVEESGPVFAGLEAQGASLRLHFTHAAGLHFSGAVKGACTIAGADRRFAAADARIEGNDVLVSAAEIAQPVAVRLDWQNAPEGWLLNGDNLPAMPFRSDDWPAGASAGRAGR